MTRLEDNDQYVISEIERLSNLLKKYEKENKTNTKEYKTLRADLESLKLK